MKSRRETKTKIIRLLAGLVVVVSTPAFGADGDWNQWRGPNRDSVVASSVWPDTLQGNLTLVWEKPHSPSYSGPIVSGDTVFTTETIDKAKEKVTAYRLETGEVLWTREWPGSMAVPFFAAANGDWIRSTPACSEDALVVLGMRDVLVCLDPITGNEKWRVDFPAQLGSPLPSFGAVCSPLIDGEAVFVQTGGALVKLSLSDGQVQWTALEDTAGMMSSGAFSSPTVATIAEKRQLLVQTRQKLCGVDLQSGAVLWSEPIQAFRGMNILTPTVIGNRVFTSAHSGKAQMFEISRSDTGDWKVTEMWVQKLQAYMSSPVVIGESIFMHMKNRRVAAMNASDGEIQSTSSPFGKYWSMVTDGNKILALDNSGELILAAPSGGDLSIVDKQKVANDAWAHLAIQGDLLIVRDLVAIKVYRWQ